MSNKDFQNGFALGYASGGVVEVIDATEIDALEDLIDNSGVLEDTEGSVTEKVEELIGKVAYELKPFECITNVSFTKNGFPNKAKIHLPNVTKLTQTFAYWNTEPIPIVEELTITAPLVTDTSRMCLYNLGVKKVVLNLSENCINISGSFNACNIREVVLNFSTKNVTSFERVFSHAGVLKIVGELDLSSATNVTLMFYRASVLNDVAFVPNTISISISFVECSKLTSESVQSIIDGLKTVETAQTLTLHRNIVLTDEQKATINAKGWTLAQ